MRILVINWQDIKNPLGGGAEVHMHEIFSRLASKGHEVDMIVSQFPGSPNEEVIDGINVHRRGGRNLFNFYVRGMYRWLRASKEFDVVVDDINKIPFFTPSFVKEPLAAIVHHFFGGTIFKETNPLFAGYVYLTESMVPSMYSRIPFVAVSESTRKELLRKGIKGSMIEVVSNAVDSSLYRLSPVPPDKQTIGYLGRIKKYKSVDHLIKAFAMVAGKFPGAELLIVGDGDNIDGLKELARKLRVESRVKFTGKVSDEEKVRLLQRMTFLVNPSAKEGWGLTVIEANACGRPVIAADVPGLRDSVLDNKTGLLYEYGNIEALANKIESFLSSERSTREFGEVATQWASRFTWDNSADKMESFLEKVAAKQFSSKVQSI